MLKMAWSLGLVESMKNVKMQMISNDIAVVIKDKYPKAKYHYLILPMENIPSIYHLKHKHITMLMEMELLAKNIIEICDKYENDFKIGYHASPSMQRLHLHVISKDFNSHFLKTKVHWNSFNTEFFLPYQDVHNQINEHGKLDKMDQFLIKKLLSTELKCHMCDLIQKNMPDLKKHISIHVDHNPFYNKLSLLLYNYIVKGKLELK